MTSGSALHRGNWRVELEYDGARFCGWERQLNGLGVRQVVEDALFELLGERVTVEGSGRTDAGVHALSQTASFHLLRPMPPRKLRLALNSFLPEDVAVVSCEPADPAFHARYSATGKTYRYSIINGPVAKPLLRRNAFHYPLELDVARMAEAAAGLLGTHDFRAFAKEAWRRKNCVRTIHAADVRSTVMDPITRRIEVEIRGSGFLYNMVRIVAGTLIDVGVGRRPVSTFADLIGDGRRMAAGFTVPPYGLCLVKVEYDGPPVPPELADDDGPDVESERTEI